MIVLKATPNKLIYHTPAMIALNPSVINAGVQSLFSLYILVQSFPTYGRFLVCRFQRNHCRRKMALLWVAFSKIFANIQWLSSVLLLAQSLQAYDGSLVLLAQSLQVYDGSLVCRF